MGTTVESNKDTEETFSRNTRVVPEVPDLTKKEKKTFWKKKSLFLYIVSF
jgi:hypothetical protein